MALKSFISSLRRLVPVSRRRHELELENLTEYYHRATKLGTESRAKAIEAEHKRIDELVAKLTRIDFTRRHTGHYAVCVECDQRMMGVSGFSDDLSIIAKRVAMMVEREISSCRFVQRCK